MFINYVFSESAFKHGIAEADIRRAFSFSLFDGLIEGYDNKYLLTGFDSRGNVEEYMAAMSEEEADALDELLTRTTPKVNPAVRGITARKGFKMVLLDDFSADYIAAKALATRQTPEEIIAALIRKELASAS